MMHLKILIRSIIRFSNWVSNGAIVAIMLMICADVVATRLFGYPIYGTTEMVEELTAILALYSLNVAESEQGHLRISILADRLPPKWQNILNIFGYLLGFLIMSVLSWRTIVTTIHFITFRAAKQVTFYFPLWPFGVLLSIATLSFSILLLSKLINKTLIQQ